MTALHSKAQTGKGRPRSRPVDIPIKTNTLLHPHPSPRPLLSPADVFLDPTSPLTLSARKRKPTDAVNCHEPRARFPSLSIRSPNNCEALDASYAPLCVNSPGRSVLCCQGVDEAYARAKGEIKFLGRGSFGSVVVGSWRGLRVAVKVIPRECGRLTRQKREDSVFSERNLLGLKHDHVVRVHDVFTSQADGSSIVVMEYVGKANLLSVCEQYPDRLTEEFVIKCIRDVSLGLEFLHSHNIMHLDVKPGNVLVSSRGICKLGDFGCSRKIFDEQEDEEEVDAADKENQRRPNMVGTSGFQAPELLKGLTVTPKCDIYSFGVLIWQLVSLEQPFQGLHPHSVIFQVVSLQKRPHSERADASALSPLFRSCWRSDAADRPEWSSVFRVLEKLEKKNAPPLKKKSRSTSLRL